MQEIPEYQLPIMKRTIWDYLFYLSMLVVGVWLVLKVTGYIQTPLWLEFGVPGGALFIGFLTFYQGLMNKMFAMQRDISKLAINDARTEERLKHVEIKLTHIDCDVESLKTDVKSLQTGMDFVKKALK